VRVYHYLEAKWALDDIRRRRLKLSKIDDMNDPYELRCVCSDDPRSQEALEKTATEVGERYGVECFSRSWNNILMWSHYGDKHRGICLGFDVPEAVIRPVEYVADVQAVGRLMVEKHRDFDQGKGLKLVDRLCGAKYGGWSYEEEIRVHGERHEIDEETGYYFVEFGTRLKLKEVIAGVRFPFSRRPIEDALKGYPEQVTITKVACSLTRFEIVIDENGFLERSS
jgi:hypothetical protein